MTIRVSIHAHPEEEAKIFEHTGEAGKFIVLHICEASIFINDRAKALEISSLLERAAQQWESEACATRSASIFSEERAAQEWEGEA